MSYRIILEAAQPAINIDSKLINGAKLRFYDYDSLLPAPVYSSYSLSVSLGNEVTANNGFFPDMWAHNGQAYRVEWLDVNDNILRVYDRIDAGTGKDILEALGTGLSGLYDDVNQALSDVSALEEIIRQKEIAITAINTALSEKQEIASEAASLADSARQIAQGARNATSAYKDAVMDAKTIVLENTEAATGAANAAALSAIQVETALNDTETGLASKASLESVNSLTVRIDTAEGQITNYFNLKADKTDLDLKLDASTYNGFIISYNDWKSGIESFTTSQLDTNTNLQGQINGKASTSSLNSAVSRLDGAESAINTLQTTTATKNYVDGQLLLKASASDVSQINLQLSGFGTESGVVKSAVDAVSGRVLALENDHVTINQFNTLSGIIDAPGGLLSRMSAVEGITGSLSATYATLSSVNSLITQVANNAAAITNEATARSAADAANASAISGVSANLSVYGPNNLVQNSDIVSLDGWSFYTPATSGIEHGRNGAGTDWQIPGINNLFISQDGEDQSAYGVWVQDMPVTSGKWYNLSVLYANHRCSTDKRYRFFDKNKNPIGDPVPTITGVEDFAGGQDANNWGIWSKTIQVPSGAAYVRMNLQKNAGIIGSGYSWAWFCEPMVAEVQPNAPDTKPKYVAGGTAPVVAAMQAQTTINQTAIADVKGSMAQVETIAAASGSDPAIVKVKSGYGGSEVSTAAKIITLINYVTGVAIPVMKAVGGYVFFQNPISIDVGTKRLTLGANSNHILWFGNATIAPPDQTKDNSIFAFGTNGKVYYGGQELTSQTKILVTQTGTFTETHNTTGSKTVYGGVSVSGGTGPYTYFWMIPPDSIDSDAGDTTVPIISNRTAASINLTRSLVATEIMSGVLQCTVTDSASPPNQFTKLCPFYFNSSI